MTPDPGTNPSTDPNSAAELPVAQQSVVNSVTLPQKKGEFAIDFDGSGAKNQLGAVLAAVASMGFDMQTELDREMSRGSVLVLLELLAESTDQASGAKLRGYLGSDADGDPSDNFSGNEAFGVAPDSFDSAALDGSITAGKLAAGPGRLSLPLPLIADKPPVMLNVQQAFIQGDVTASGITNAVIGGAISQSDVDGVLLPAIAELVTNALTDSRVLASAKTLIRSLFDDNKDGTITVAEIQDSLVADVLKMDVDTDNDGKFDAISLGIGLSTISCTIQK